ncbi:hypothetical protein HAX54_008816 [Datura stramonium]|uniref:FAD-binding PCMH-type domain-containing protein n=1 Tax=Datura stramonium TaxID=4076 RepID=A0ABS8TGP3_DATST|nr:hypothetical protein [Datura stramonium]
MTKIPLFCSSLIVFVVVIASASHENQTFLECLETNSNPSYPISSLVFSPNNSSFPSVLQAYIRNLRFNESTTRKPLFILTAQHESHIQASIICAKSLGVQMKIRSGGHDYEGLSYVSDVPFFVVDMFNFRSVNVSIEDESAWVEVGATLGEVTVFRVPRFYDQNALDLAYLWQRRADKWDDDLFMRMIIDVVNSTTPAPEKTIRVSFFTLFLGDSDRLLSLLNQSFPELGLERKDCIEMSWIESVLYYTNSPIAPIDALLSRSPPLTYLKRKSDYLQKPMSKEGLEFIFKKMIELQTPTAMTFNPYGGRMSEISPLAKPFPHRAGNIAKIQYATNWNEKGVEAANHYLNLTRILYDYMTPFVSKSPRLAFLNYRDLDLGVTHNGKLSYFEGKVYGVKYFKKENFNRLVKIKTKVDPQNFFRNEQSIPVYPAWKN